MYINIRLFVQLAHTEFITNNFHLFRTVQQFYMIDSKMGFVMIYIQIVGTDLRDKCAPLGYKED